MWKGRDAEVGLLSALLPGFGHFSDVGGGDISMHRTGLMYRHAMKCTVVSYNNRLEIIVDYALLAGSDSSVSNM